VNYDRATVGWRYATLREVAREINNSMRAVAPVPKGYYLAAKAALELPRSPRALVQKMEMADC